MVDAFPPRSRVVRSGVASTRNERRFDAAGGRRLADMIEHQQRRAQQRGRVGDVLARDVRRAAVHRFEDADVFAEVRGADGAEPADEAGAQIRHDIAVQIREQQHVELFRLHHEVHAGRVDDLFVVGDVRIRRRRPSRAHRMNRPSLIFMMLALWIAVMRLRPMRCA